MKAIYWKVRVNIFYLFNLEYDVYTKKIKKTLQSFIMYYILLINKVVFYFSNNVYFGKQPNDIFLFEISYFSIVLKTCYFWVVLIFYSSNKLITFQRLVPLSIMYYLFIPLNSTLANGILKIVYNSYFMISKDEHRFQRSPMYTND